MLATGGGARRELPEVYPCLPGHDDGGGREGGRNACPCLPIPRLPRWLASSLSFLSRDGLDMPPPALCEQVAVVFMLDVRLMGYFCKQYLLSLAAICIYVC